MNVLSLFDGISCGQIALNKANITYNDYYASEIDKFAITVANHNYPKTKNIGRVEEVNCSELPQIDLLIGGSPCQGFSFAGKQLNFKDPRSILFFEFVRLLEECRPKYFLLENVRMDKRSRDIISKYIGVEPIEINSSLFSAQNRVRLYWTSIPIHRIVDKKISLSSIIGEECKGAAKRARYKKGNSGPTMQKIEIRKDDKANAITTVKKNSMVFFPNNRIRYLSVNEAERLQTIPINYTSPVSEHQAHKLIGNAWTVDVIAHIFKGINQINCYDTIKI